MNPRTLIVLVMLIAGFVPGFGQVPEVITYQGYLTDAAGDAVADGTYAMTFRIFDVETGGTAVWTETLPAVAVSHGLFRVFLGESTPFTMTFDTGYWLEVQVGQGTPQSVRTRLASAPYSLMSVESERVDGFDASAQPVANQLLALDATGKFPVSAIPDVPPGGAAGGDLTGTYPNPTIAANTVTSAKIQDGQVATADLATGAVSSAKILDGAVHTQDIADGAVTQAKLDAGVTLPPGGLAGGDLTGTYPNPTIATNAVTSSKIQDGQVQTADIQDNAVTANKILPSIVSSIAGVSNDGGDIDLVAGANVTITPNDAGNAITIDAAGGGGGDITAVWAGDGISGGGDQGDVTVSVANPLQLTGSADGVIRGTNTNGDWGQLGGSDGRAVYGYSNNPYSGLTSTGVMGESGYPAGVGVYGRGETGVFARCTISDCSGYLGGSDAGASGRSSPTGCFGALGHSNHGVYGFMANPSTDFGMWSAGDAYVDGYMAITGNLTVFGNKNFLTDHPLDPENKLLRHSCVESPENLLVYRGKARLDAQGNAVVELPEYFPALANESDATVTLTPVGRPFLVGYDWQDGRTFVAYGEPGREVSWVVYADRDDPVIRLCGLPVEAEKTPGSKLCARGKLLVPEAYGYPVSMGQAYEAQQESARMRARTRAISEEQARLTQGIRGSTPSK